MAEEEDFPLPRGTSCRSTVIRRPHLVSRLVDDLDVDRSELGAAAAPEEARVFLGLEHLHPVTSADFISEID